GRDSSAVLAVAVRYARRTGRPDPVPVIVRHLDDPAADETSWQELVLAHLGIHDPVVLTFRDEQRLLGDPARASLRARGPIWPAAVTLHSAIYRELGPGQMLTGEGGDHTLLPQRITQLRNGLHHRRPTQVVGGLVQLLATRAARQGLGSDVPRWLTPEGLGYTQQAFRAVSRVPVRFDDAMLSLFDSVFDEILLHNFGAMAQEYGLVAVHPFVDRCFRTAWARAGGALGFAGRNDNMRRLFADVLPDPILVRSTKADFTASRWGEREREFAQNWDGSGVDPSLIRADELRREWLAPTPHPLTEYLLHHVWATTRAAGPEEPA
ncbi:MAG: asparagine synthase-related protein, partial [Propionibacteriaceae bacterium]